MKTIHKITALLVLFPFLLSSCATSGRPGEQTQWSSPGACIAAHVAGGALAGAVTGALFGAVSGGKKKVAAGAGVGAAAGGALAFAYAWGACFAAFTKVTSEQTKGYGETRKQIGYKSSQGVVARIEEYSIDPAAVAPGGNPVLHASYYVMTPEDSEITVTESVLLKVYDPEKRAFQEAGPPASGIVVVNPGLRTASSEFTIPNADEAEEGKFLIVFRISTQGKTVEKEMPLTITKNREILAKAKSESSSRQRKVRPTYVASSEAAATDNVAESGSKNATVGDNKRIEITASKANIRENPDTHAKIVMSANKGKKYVLLNTVTISNKQWHQIKLDGGALAWVVASLCKLVE